MSNNALMMQIGMDGGREEIRGHLLFRDAAMGESEIPKGHKAMLVVGVVLVPDHFTIPGESMVRIKGFNTGGEYCIFTHPETKLIEKHYAGWTINDLLMQPIWKF